MATKQTILIVEDEAGLRSVLGDILRDAGYQVLEAANGREGVDTAVKNRPDLILLDLLMPVMGGGDALKKLRKDTWGKKVPVMILTNLSANDEQLIMSMVEERPVCYLIKSSWQMRDIVKKVQETLNELKPVAA